MTTTADPLEALKEYGREQGYDLSWLQRRDTWGTRIEPDQGGLVLEAVERGPHGEAPDESRNLTGRPRGAVSRPGVPRVGNYSVRTKADIWLRNAAGLWEEALQRQWSS